jgi:hypothetical protein
MKRRCKVDEIPLRLPFRYWCRLECWTHKIFNMVESRYEDKPQRLRVTNWTPSKP